MQIIHDTIKIYCFDVLVGKTILRILNIIEKFVTYALFTQIKLIQLTFICV